MANFPKEHKTLYFDSAIRTQKKESVLAFIEATYHAKKGNTEDKNFKKDLRQRVKYGFGLFRNEVKGKNNGGIGDYNGSVEQFQTFYTLGLEMGIWKNSNLDLNDLAIEVAENKITITDYFDIIFLNYIKPINGKIVHLLYQVLTYMKENKKQEINKKELESSLNLEKKPTSGNINALFNFLKETSYFNEKKSTLELNPKYNIDDLISKCNKKYLEKDGYDKAKKELEKDEEKYIKYLTTRPITNISNGKKYIISIKDYTKFHKKFFDYYNYMYWPETANVKYNVGDIIYLYFSTDVDTNIRKIKMKVIVDDIHIPREQLEEEGYYKKVGIDEEIDDYSIKVKIIGKTNSDELSYKNLNKTFNMKVPQQGTIEITNYELIKYIEKNFNDNKQFDISLTEETLGQILKHYYDSSKWNKNTGIMLFGIKYGEYIESKNKDKTKIIDFSNIEKSYIAELNKSIALKKFVNINEKIIEDRIGKTDVSTLQRLNNGYNKIYYGIPGCGKSYTVKKIAQEICEEEYIIRTTFYSDYTNSDFIGQIIPKVDDDNNNNILYDIQSGPFTEALVKAIDNPTKNICLIIEEINRGNAAAIFGDIFQLLDRKDGKSEYSIKNYTITKYLEKNCKCTDKNYSYENIRIPSNLIILGTMNTSDQNVFTLDTAFKRRWRMEHIKNNVNESVFAMRKVPILHISWKDFVNKINQVITDDETDLGINGEDKQIGAYFISEEEWDEMNELESKGETKEASKIFIEKVLIYLWEDVAKLEKTSIFNKEYKTFDKVAEDFSEGSNVLNIDLEINIDVETNVGKDKND